MNFSMFLINALMNLFDFQKLTITEIFLRWKGKIWKLEPSLSKLIFLSSYSNDFSSRQIFGVWINQSIRKLSNFILYIYTLIRIPSLPPAIKWLNLCLNHRVNEQFMEFHLWSIHSLIYTIFKIKSMWVVHVYFFSLNPNLDFKWLHQVRIFFRKRWFI